MKGYELSVEALADLQDIWIYIAQDNPVAADKLESEIYQACEFLARNPRVGHKRPDLTKETVHFWPVRGHYLVIYQRESRPLKIVRILHAARDVEEQI